MRGVDKLSGIDLDYWVLRSATPYSDSYCLMTLICKNTKIDWNFIGPLIEKYSIEWAWRIGSGLKKYYWADTFKDPKDMKKTSGNYSISYNSILEAIKRCIVKIKYGETVKID